MHATVERDSRRSASPMRRIRRTCARMQCALAFVVIAQLLAIGCQHVSLNSGIDDHAGSALPAPPSKHAVDPTARTTAGTSRRPRLVIHIGPSKTATTTIQHDLKSLDSKLLLQKDGYVYFGRYHSSSHRGSRLLSFVNLFDRECIVDQFNDYLSRVAYQMHPMDDDSASDLATPIRQSVLHPTQTQNGTAVPRCIRAMKSSLDRLRLDGKSLILSDEAYSYVTLYSSMQNASATNNRKHSDGNNGIVARKDFFRNLRLLTDGWDIVVVVGYRRLFEWFLSAVKEINAKISFDVKHTGGLWPDQGGDPLRQTWPLVRQWHRTGLIEGKGMRTTQYSFVDSSIPAWQKGDVDTAIVNMHSDVHVSQQLMCDIVDDAPHSCRHLQKRKDALIKNSRGISWSIYNQIVYAAASRKLIDTTVQAENTRVEMTEALVDYHMHTLNRSMIDFPLRCPSKQHMKLLLKTSLAVEEKLLPDFYRTPEGGEAHRASFEHVAYGRREFCSVDTARLLERHATWRDFLKSLGGERNTRWPVSHAWTDLSKLSYPRE